MYTFTVPLNTEQASSKDQNSTSPVTKISRSVAFVVFVLADLIAKKTARSALKKM